MEKIFVRNAKNETYYAWYVCPECGHETIENPARGFNDCPKCGQSFGQDEEITCVCMESKEP